MSASIDSTDIDGIHQESFQFNDWRIITRKSHILHSKCCSPFVCNKKENENNLQNKCLFCKYEAQLEMPHMPDMTYANNSLKVEHNLGFGIEYNCMDSLLLVKKELPQHIKVAAAENWLKARSECEFTKILKKPFDWTFNTDYQGSLYANSSGQSLCVEQTNDRIDIEKLKVREEILYYDDVHLFEDELADHGVAQCSVKIRVMKNSFFILLRYFLRIDNVLVRINDTRLYYETGSDFFLREYSSKGGYVSELNLPSSILIDPVELSRHLPSQQLICEKLKFP